MRYHDAEVEQMLTERACQRLSHRYALFADRGHASRIAELFTPDGVFEAQGMTLTGRDQIRTTLRRREDLLALRTIHQLTNIHVEVTGPTTARGWVTLCLFRRVAGGEGEPATDTRPVLVGHYEDSYEERDGEWLIHSRRQHVHFRDPEDPGWDG